jgi:hypothetical protein
MDTWILRMCRRSCSRQLLAWGLALTAGVVFGALNIRYVSNFINGPFPMGKAELEQIGDPGEAPQYFVRVSGSRAFDTGIRQITTTERGGVEESRRVSAEYYALQVGSRFLIVKSSSGEPTAVEGRLEPTPADLDRQLFGTPEMQAARPFVYPFYLDTDSFRLPGHCAIAASLVFLWLFCRKGIPAWRRLQDPSSHPVVARVASWGDPIAVAAEIERECRTPQIRSLGDWTITKNYLVQNSFLDFDVVRLEDLLWAYKRVTKKRVNFIPAGKDYHAILVCYGAAVTVQGSEQQVDEVLRYASRRTPWAVFGYSADLENLFKRRPQDLCLAVEDRRREIEN